MRLLRGALVASVLLIPPLAPTAWADDAPVEQQIVDTMNKLFGVHPGWRANHAKGVVVQGSFTASADAASISKAAQFAPGSTVPLTARFSDATGVPTIPDGSPNANPHGLAIKFHLKDGSDTDIVINSLPIFPVATAEDFLALLQAAAASPPDAPKPTKLDQFVAAHPSVPKAVGALKTPESFATEQYNGVNTFIFTNKDGAKVATRYKAVPAAGVHYLTADEAAKKDPNYLVAELPERLKKGPVSFQLLVQVANPGDPTKDPTISWPEDRKTVALGTITLTSAEADSETAQKSLLFLPGSVTDGIEASDDPMIGVRDQAYAVSFSRRQQ